VKQTESTVNIKNLRLPETLYDTLSERAAKHGRSIEDEIFIRLRECRDFTSVSPIYLDDTQRNELSAIAGRLIKTPADLISWAKQMVTLKVGEVDIPLGQQLVKRLESRRFGKTWPELMRSMVTEGLETAVGLR
jgi:hypothetical protein